MKFKSGGLHERHVVACINRRGYTVHQWYQTLTASVV
jgi:hypothetical protein